MGDLEGSVIADYAENKPLSVELFAGTGSGKSTTATGTFSLAKMHGINCEYVPEYAKDKAWEKTLTTYYNPFYIALQQFNRQFRLMGQVDFMITDSPMLQQIVYNDDPDFYTICKILANRFEPMTFFIKRSKEFNPKGRKHNLEEAIKVDEKIKKLLKDEGRHVIEIDGDFNAPNIVLQHVLTRLNKITKYNITEV